MSSHVLAIVLVAATACGTEPMEPTIQPDVPEDTSTFVEVRNCRSSADHDLRKIRVLADGAAREPYLGRATEFPTDSILLKAEYDFADTDCSGEILEWTVMRRIADGPAAQLGWNWQRVGVDRKVVTENEDRCFQCHSDCVDLPYYRNTCAEP